MTKQVPAVPAAPKRNLRVCASCRNTGKNGAQFVLLVDGEDNGGRFHRPCGERIAANAPQGTAAKLVHFSEAQTAGFWMKKFIQAEKKKNGGQPKAA